MPKFQRLTIPEHPDDEVWIFQCPGCKYGHSVRIKGPGTCWTWNNDPNKPTVSPSLLVAPTDPDRRCHSFVTNGFIKFMDDSYHKLAGQVVPLPDFNL